MPAKTEFIRLRGVRQNNLKGFDLDLPVGQLTVVTGLSGAGKSSLVFDTLHAEGQRRYVETFSPYTRQFMELLDRPKVDGVENIRPSIAIQQSNTVKTSRSTVGTLTELCDYFKVWFAQVATLHDPLTGEPIHDDNPQTIWARALREFSGRELLLTFAVNRPGKLKWPSILQTLDQQGFTRVVRNGQVTRIDALRASDLEADESLAVIQDRIRMQPAQQARFIEAAQQAFAYGNGRLQLFDLSGKAGLTCTEGLTSPVSGERYRAASPALFSFNSPLGACATCRGFGRVIEIDDRLVIPDERVSIDEGAIRAFQGEVYGGSLRDLQRAAKRLGIRTHVPYADLSPAEKTFVQAGDPDYREGNDQRQWYGVKRFFDWLESKSYRMHVRVFLSKFRSYRLCPDCQGARLQPQSLLWKWQGRTLPDLYRMPVDELIPLIEPAAAQDAADHALSEHALALNGILHRLGFLQNVGLGYLSLDRSSRTLSGGETMRVNLTSCLGSALTDTLFVLDEPSVGLHARDMDRLIRILRRLTDLGNTVVVVEHDEAIMRAADHLIEIGPEPGVKGGHLTFSGNFERILKSDTHTGRFLSDRDGVPAPATRRSQPTNNKQLSTLSIYGASKYNIQKLDIHLPQQQLVCLSGVSGSGKSTLLNHVIYQNLLAQKGEMADDPAAIADLESSLPISEVVLVDQSPVSKTPRSNPALFTKAWDEIRKCFAGLDAAQAAGMTAGHFSFNGGEGRCPACSGLGYERIEMQFVSDVFVPCESCEGRRFKNEVLDIEFQGKSIADILEMDIDEAVLFFGEQRKVTDALRPLIDVGLGYLKLGQPLNTLSGGESQRLKLVRYLTRVTARPSPGRDRAKGSHHAMILIDEPTTGLHRADVKHLIDVLQKLVDAGHSLIVIEHNIDLLKCADWIIEIGPEAGSGGGRIVAEGTPEQIAATTCETAAYLRVALNERGTSNVKHRTSNEATRAVAEAQKPFGTKDQILNIGRSLFDVRRSLEVIGAREHNLKNVSVTIPHRKMSVITGVSGSGKSSLAFDVVFAEGQRRFMESMSAYARQFVEQMPRADVDALHGIAPSVAIEQRVTRGTRKSTVATITEVAQYLRLLYARIGIQHSPLSGDPLVQQSEAALLKRLQSHLADASNQQPTKKRNQTTNNQQPTTPPLYLCAPLIRGRKGHHEPLANWARDHGYTQLRIDGTLVPLDGFKRLDRYREHDIDLVVSDLSLGHKAGALKAFLTEALRLGKGSAFLLPPGGGPLEWLSTTRTDPVTGEAFPELDPKHFSWNSPRGWCPSCRGYGQLIEGLSEEVDNRIGEMASVEPQDAQTGAVCPDCLGARLNPVSRAVRLPLKKAAAGQPASISLPELLQLTPGTILATLRQLKTTPRTRPVLDELLPEIEERLRFMDRVGLGYLQLDRATATLSGGEAQRIRLAAQLGSNLSGVLYVLDEPSIGLHAQDNARLLESLDLLRSRGNTLVVVEHNASTMQRADHLIDIGPGAGIHGGEIVASGSLAQLKKNKRSVTAHFLRQPIKHPLRGHHRDLPPAWSPRKSKDMESWIVLRGAALRNLKGFDLAIPKNRLTVVCGVSGAGKSTLIRDLLKPLVQQAIDTKTPKLTPGEHRTSNVQHRTSNQQTIQHSMFDAECSMFKSLSNAASIRKVIEVDHSPIGKTTRSTPATYIGAFDVIRDLFASLPEANMRGYQAGTFSFNTKGGRCETCKGAGRIKLEMNFMPDTHVTCESCNGRRYGPELEAIRWHGKSIADVLDMSFEEAAEFFSFHTQLSSLLQLMVETGLGYLTLGQYSPTLSGGEAQRMKLVSELAKGLPSFKERQYQKGQGNLYILEEPTIGLHLSDVVRLAELLHRLVDQGHSVVVIEHHLDIIREADYLVEIGPGGGEAGGELLYQGNLAGMRKVKNSPTATFL